MQHTHIEGLGALLHGFGDIVEDIRRKPYDLLDASKTMFDRDFLEFNVHIHDLELAIQVRIAPSSPIASARHAVYCFVCGCRKAGWKADLTFPSFCQGFINASFEDIRSTEAALNLLQQFQVVLQRDSLRVRQLTCL